MAAHEVLFLTSDNLTRKRWAKELFHVILPAVEFNDLIGTDTNAIIQMRTELGKGEGDTLTFGIRLPLLQTGIVGADTVEGNEEKLRKRDFKTTIEELNFAVDTGGKMDQQRVPYNLVQEGKDGLQEKWASHLSDYVMATLCGDSSYLVSGKTFAQACEEPDTGHILRVNDAATDAALVATDILDLHMLDRMKQLAKLPTGTNCYKVRPLIIGGKEYYRVILHDYVYDNLRKQYNVGDWGDLQRNAKTLQVPNVEIEYNGMLVSKSERVRKSPTNANAYRNVLLGAQAAVFAWGGAGESKSSVMSFVPYTKDAERFLMIRGGGIFGCKKTRFDSVDFGVIVGSSYATALPA